MAQTEPLGSDGCVAGLPLRGEERKEGFAGDAERWWLAQAPHGCLLDLIHEGDEVLMERAVFLIFFWNFFSNFFFRFFFF